MKTDVLIIGGGMCGVLTAHKLKEAGVDCVIVEGKTVGGGVTQNTTAKITAQHGLIYADLIARFGTEKARQYYDANTQAISSYCGLATRFPCDFEEKTAYVYTTDDRHKLNREADAYQKIGIPAKIVDMPQLPLSTVGAIAMEQQAQFHPLKLLYELANCLDIYEHTFVHKLEGNTAHTSGGKITAQYIILATHFPLVNLRGLYFMKLYQHRSYVFALKNAPLLDGMFIDGRENGLSFRTYGDMLFVGGGDHRTGKTGGDYAELTQFTKHAYPCATVAHRWATQDCMTLDKVPYVGLHRMKNVYFATGFNKWGMTGSMAAAERLAELIVHGDSNARGDIYYPGRSMLSRQLFVNLGAAAAGLLSPGGKRCTHMGCKLHRNAAENTWDCACHGSRFDQQGHVIQNPAKKNLKR